MYLQTMIAAVAKLHHKIQEWRIEWMLLAHYLRTLKKILSMEKKLIPIRVYAVTKVI